jgi:hypothetical protein
MGCILRFIRDFYKLSFYFFFFYFIFFIIYYLFISKNFYFSTFSFIQDISFEKNLENEPFYFGKWYSENICNCKGVKEYNDSIFISKCLISQTKEGCKNNKTITQRNIENFYGKKIYTIIKNYDYLELLNRMIIINKELKCKNGYKKCGYIDKNKNILCLEYNEKCPLLDIVVNEQSYINESYYSLKFDYENYYLHFSNNLTENYVITNMFLKNDKMMSNQKDDIFLLNKEFNKINVKINSYNFHKYIIYNENNITTYFQKGFETKGLIYLNIVKGYDTPLKYLDFKYIGKFYLKYHNFYIILFPIIQIFFCYWINEFFKDVKNKYDNIYEKQLIIKNIWKPYLLSTIQFLLYINYLLKWIEYTNILTENFELLFLIIVIQFPCNITYLVFSVYLVKTLYIKNKLNLKFSLKKIFNNKNNYVRVNSEINKIEMKD